MRSLDQPAAIQLFAGSLGLKAAQCRQSGMKPAAVVAEHGAHGIECSRRIVSRGERFGDPGVHFLNQVTPSIEPTQSGTPEATYLSGLGQHIQRIV